MNIFETFQKDMIATMKAIIPVLKGKADGKMINMFVAGLCK